MSYSNMLVEGYPARSSVMSTEVICDIVRGYQYQMGYREDAPFHELRTDLGYIYYREADIHSFVYSATGRTLEEPLRSEDEYGITYVDGEYRIAMGDGAPFYSSRWLKGIRKGDRIIGTVELIQQAVIGIASNGIFEVEYCVDDKSVWGCYIESVTPVASVDTAFDQVVASSVLVDADQDHSASMLRDHNIGTAWVEGVPGNGVGETITLRAKTPQKVHGVKIATGFRKSMDLLQKNGIPLGLQLRFSDGTELNAAPVPDDFPMDTVATVQWLDNFNDFVEDGPHGWEFEAEYMDFISFGQEIETEWIEITITNAAAGQKYEDTCISEIIVY